jgi:hypothetical protein
MMVHMSGLEATLGRIEVACRYLARGQSDGLETQRTQRDLNSSNDLATLSEFYVGV